MLKISLEEIVYRKAYKELKRAYLAYRTLCPETSLWVEVEVDDTYTDIDLFELMDKEFDI